MNHPELFDLSTAGKCVSPSFQEFKEGVQVCNNIISCAVRSCFPAGAIAKTQLDGGLLDNLAVICRKDKKKRRKKPNRICSTGCLMSTWLIFSLFCGCILTDELSVSIFSIFMCLIIWYVKIKNTSWTSLCHVHYLC